MNEQGRNQLKMPILMTVRARSRAPSGLNSALDFSNAQWQTGRKIRMEDIVRVFNRKYRSVHLAKSIAATAAVAAANDANSKQQVDSDDADEVISPRRVGRKAQMKRDLVLFYTSSRGLTADDDDNDNDNDDDDEATPVISFRLSRSSTRIVREKRAFLSDMNEEKMTGANAVRLMKETCHELMDRERTAEETQNIQLNKERRQHTTTIDQRFFQKVYGNMGFDNLRAVDKAYTEREWADMLLARRRAAQTMRDSRKLTLQKVDFYRDEQKRRGQDAVFENMEHVRMAKMNKEQTEEKKRDTVKELRYVAEKRSRERRADQLMAINFSKQHLGVSKAIERHEWVKERETRLGEVVSRVNHSTEVATRQRDLVRRFMDERNKLRTIQSATEKSLIGETIRELNDLEENEAKKRVELLKFLGNTKSHMQISLVDLIQNFKPENNDYDDFMNRLEYYLFLNSNNHVKAATANPKRKQVPQLEKSKVKSAPMDTTSFRKE